jgi:tetratricopeptide (TPR) repeat protein
MAARSSQGSAALLEAFLAQSEDAMKNRQNDRALEVIKLAKTEADKMPSTPSGVQLLMRLGALCEQLDQRSCADNAYTRSLDDSRRLFGDRTTQVGAALRALAGHNASSDRCEDARAQYKELLAMTDDTDEKGNILSQLAFVDSWCQFPEDTQEDHDSRSVEAAALLEQALKMKEALHGKNNPEVLALAVQLGQLRNMTQDYQGAIVALERLVDAGGNPLFDPDHVLSLLGRSYAATGNLEKAEMEYGQWVKLREGAVGRDHPACQEPLEHLATVFTREGKYHEAEGAWHRVREICENELRVHPQARMRTIPSCVDALEGLGSLAAKQKRYSEAERLLNQALSLGKEGPTSGRRGTLLALARLYADRKQVEKADSFYRRRIQAGITDPSTLMEYVEFLKRNHRDAEADKVLADAKEFVAAFEKRTGRSVLHPE